MIARTRLPPDTVERHLVARSLLGDLGGLDVLDVGGRRGEAARFWPTANIVAVNVELPADVVLYGTTLPFADGSFDVALSIDVIEHIPPSARLTHVGELLRVARHNVLISTPYGTERHRSMERALLDYFARLGRTHRFLDEHVRLGLLGPEDVEALTERHGFVARYHGDVDQVVQLAAAAHAVRSRPWRIGRLLRSLLAWPDLSTVPTPYDDANRVFLVS